MDVHKNSISVGLLEPGSDSPLLDKVRADEEPVRRLIARFDDPSQVWACYEAGATGYELARVVGRAGMHSFGDPFGDRPVVDPGSPG